MPEIKGDGLDMGQLMNMFASKQPPENTIKRIEALESELNGLKDKLNNMGNNNAAPATVTTGLDADAMDKLNDLLRRVQSLETRADKTDRGMDQHE